MWGCMSTAAEEQPSRAAPPQEVGAVRAWAEVDGQAVWKWNGDARAAAAKASDAVALLKAQSNAFLTEVSTCGLRGGAED